VIFGISEASYGYTNADWTFLKHTLARTIFDLAIPFDSLVPLPPTIWLNTSSSASFKETRILELISEICEIFEICRESGKLSEFE
jgi:hypothetical protein